MTVRLDRPGTHILVLSAYESTRWKVELGCATKLSAIHLFGSNFGKPFELVTASFWADLATPFS